MLLFMKKLLGIVVLGLLFCNTSYGALFYGKETLPIVSKPDGANCILKNNKGSWEVKTPTTVKLKLSKKDLRIVCKKNGYKTKTIIIPLKDKNDLADGVYDNVKVFDSDFEKDWFVLDSLGLIIDKNPVDAVFFLFEFGGKIIKKTGTTVKKKTGDVFSSVKKSIKAESTYANALVNSNRLDKKKINNDDSKQFKKQGYYSLILIELEKK